MAPAKSSRPTPGRRRSQRFFDPFNMKSRFCREACASFTQLYPGAIQVLQLHASTHSSSSFPSLKDIVKLLTQHRGLKLTPLPAALPADLGTSTLFDLDSLLRELWRDHPLSQRLTAASEVCSIIDEYHLDNAAYIWDHARELFLADEREAVIAGYDIIEALAQSGNLTRYQCVQIFNALTSINEDIHVQQRPRLFSSLTDRGRDLEGFELNISTLLIELIQVSFKQHNNEHASTSNSLRHRQVSTSPTFSPIDSFAVAVELAINAIKFNAKFLDDTEINRVLHFVCGITELSPSPAHAEKLIDLVDAFLIYAHVPTSVLPAVVGQLCILLLQSKESHEQQIVDKIINTFEWILCTHLKDLFIDTLLCMIDVTNMGNVMQKPSATGGGNMPPLAAITALNVILTDIQKRHTVDMGHITDLLLRLERLDADQESGQSKHALKLIQSLLKDEKCMAALSGTPDWASLHDAILKHALASLGSGYTPYSPHRSSGFSASDGGVARDVTILDDILVHLTRAQKSPHQEDTVNKLFRRLIKILPVETAETLLKSMGEGTLYIEDFDLCDGIKDVATVFLYSSKTTPRLRHLALDVLEYIYEKSNIGYDDYPPGPALVCAEYVTRALSRKSSVELQQRMIDFIVRYASDLDRREGDFREECFQKLVKEIKLQAITKPQPSNASAGNDDINWQPPVPLLCTALIKIFLANILGDARRSIGIYHILLDLLQSTELPQEVKVDISKVLVSLRSDVKYRIFVEVSPEFQDWWTSSLGSPPTNSSRILTSQAGARMTPNIFTPTPYEESLNARWWLRFVATSMVRDQKCHWDVFWLNINHVAAQLTNQSLFKGTEDQLKELRGALCSQLRKGNFQRPPEGSDLKAGDVAVRLYGILTVLIGYHDAFTKSEQEEMIVAFIYGMTAWEQTTLPCIHALTICCYELSKALEKNAYTIVTKMANIVTKSDAAIHVLEFLTGLSRITDLARSLKEDEIKTIFGVGFSYIDYVRGKRFDDAQKARGSVSGSTQPKPKMDIPGYLYALAYHVIAFWFLTLKPEDQKLHLSFVDFRLLSPDQRGMKEDQALVTLDCVYRSTKRSMNHFGPPSTPLLAPPRGPSRSMSWVSDYCVLTIECSSGPSRWVRVTERRPSGTDVRPFALLGFERGTPEEMFKICFPYGIDGPFTDGRSPVPLPDTDASKRYLSWFDRTSAVDFYKAGVVYVGECQTTESQILGNISGSPDYNHLLSGLGETLDLKGNPGNTAGLDTSPDLRDGRTTICHRDAVTALIYHVVTMMPTDRVLDPDCVNKKAHIGNDFVNIIFNNSGKPYGFSTIDSAFNFVQIVVTPEARSTFVETRTLGCSKAAYDKRWYKVQVITQPGFPKVSSAGEMKVVSGEVLAQYVRNLALNACVFAAVWASKGLEYPSSWRSRLQQIRTLRDRAGKEAEEKEKERKEALKRAGKAEEEGKEEEVFW